MNDILKQVPDARMVIISSGPEEKNLKQLVLENNLEEYVHFSGKLTDEQMPQYISAADLYVSFSKSDGSSLCLLEAFACGLPAVVSNTPAAVEWDLLYPSGIDHARRLLPERDISYCRQDCAAFRPSLLYHDYIHPESGCALCTHLGD